MSVVREIANWGGVPRVQAEVVEVGTAEDVLRDYAAAPTRIARGLGRCYGDSALAPRVLDVRPMAGVERIDEEAGLVVARGGTSFDEILAHVLPRGWFLPVVPGTRFVTVGGALASDVHGKNHHLAGTLARHVVWMEVATPDGVVRRVSADGEHAELFAATCGGMGLTGVVVRAALRLVPVESAYIRQETRPAPDLDAAMAAFEELAGRTYTVAWIDCQARGRRLGRAVVLAGEHARLEELPPRRRARALRIPGRRPVEVPVNLPPGLLNRFTVRAFNALYYHRHRMGAGSRLVHAYPFFFPLDAVGAWNRVYGRRGFLQYQCVFPLETSEAGVRALLERAAASGLGSFLAVLKLFGPGRGWLSFPIEGYTLALDFPAVPAAVRLMDSFDRIVVEHGGRIYLTKDARMPKEVFDAGYPEADRFRELRRGWDPERRLASLQSRRLGL